MIARPSWERPLRQRLRNWKRRPGVPSWIKDHGFIIVLAVFFQSALAAEGTRLLGAGGGGTGIGIGGGLAGACLGMFLRTRWQAHGWIAQWSPASRATARRIQTREALPAMGSVVAAVLAFALVAAGFSPRTGFAEAVAAATAAMAAGFLLAGGPISVGILIASGICIVAHAILSQWLALGSGNFPTRILRGSVLGWIPVLPWSMSAHGARAGGFQWLLVALPLAISLREWWRSWHDWQPWRPEREMAALAGIPEAVEAADEEPEDVAEVDEAKRRIVRQQVAFAWFGLAGYLPNAPMPRLDRLLWRWFTPRQRLISTLGSHDAFGWFAQTRWTALALALMVPLAWFSSWDDGAPAWVAWFVGHDFWYWLAFLALAVVAMVGGWPSRRSRFQPWLERMEVQGIGHFPAFALLPVCPGGWLRAAAKEWTLRAAWVSALWSLAIALAAPGFAAGQPAATVASQMALPWLFHAALFPLSAMNRLLRAVSGPTFRMHGFSRGVPSFLASLFCLVWAVFAAFALGTGYLRVALAALAITAGLGGFSLWMTLLRCKGMRLDMKPKPLV
jgi:hypothetical protein